jgi:hypothetical protein
MAKNGVLLIDAFYPRPLQKPESAAVWYEKKVQMDGIPVKLRDKRVMSGNIEERTQEYITDGSNERIVSKRRYYSKQDLLRILDQCGFVNIEFTDGYDVNGFHGLQDREAVVTSFVVKVKKKRVYTLY